MSIFEPKVPKGIRRLGHFLMRFGPVVILPAIVLLLPTPEGLPQTGHRALALFAFTGAILAFEPVSLPIAALLVPLAAVGLGTATATEAFAPFSSPVVYLILAGLFLAEALRKHGLTRRLAIQTLLASGGRIDFLVLGMMLIAALLSMWVINTAVAAMLIPVALTISRLPPTEEKQKKLLTLLGLGIAYGASVGGMGTIMGSAANAVASGLLADEQIWTFMSWMTYGFPSFLVIFPLTWWLLIKLVGVDGETIEMDEVRQRADELGSFTNEQVELLFMLGGAIFLWVMGGRLERAFALPPTIFSASMVGIIAVAYLSVRNLLTWSDVEGISWGVFLIIGAGLSLGSVLQSSGTTVWLADLLVPVIEQAPYWLTLLVLVYASALLTNLLNNTTIAAVFVPILIAVARVQPDISAVQLVLPVTLATTFGYSLPSASGRMSLIAASGIVDRKSMLGYGLVVTLASSGVLAIFFYVLTRLGLV